MPKSRPAGSLSKWFSRFGRRATAKRRGPDRQRTRRLHVEELEQRALLTVNLYVDFGDLLPATITMPENSVNGSAAWNHLGLTWDPGNGEQEWIFGPQFPYAGNPNITYVPLSAVLADPERDGFSFSIGPQNINDPFEFETGPDLPVTTIDALEASVMQMLTRMFAPFNVIVSEVAVTDLQMARDLLSYNNRLEDPNQMDPQWIDGPAPMGPIGRNFVDRRDPATNLISATGDAYVLIGGWFRNDPVLGLVPIGDEAGIFGTSESNRTNFITPPLDPMMGMPDPLPGVGIIPQPYSDGAAAVSADTIIDLALANPNIRPNVAIATAAAQLASTTFGLFHTHDGLPTVLNPFFNPDVDLLTGSDVMREGPGEYGKTGDAATTYISPASISMPYFSRFDLTRGDTNISVFSTQNAYEFFRTSADFGLNPNVNISYVTGTGAYDRITITNAGAGFSTVAVRPYRDSSFSSSSFISTWNPTTLAFTTEATPYSYLIDHTLGDGGFVAIELGRNEDIIEIDPSLATANIALFGGHGIDRLTINGTGTQSAVYSPFYRNDIGFDQTRNFDGFLTLSTNVDLGFFEFNDTSVVRLDNFDTATHLPPAFLPTKVFADNFGSAFRIDGTAGPTADPNGQELSPVIGMANLELANLKHIIIDTSIGFSLADDVITVRPNGAVPAGLLTFDIRTGGHTLGDTVHIDDSASFALIDYAVGPGLVKHSTTPGTFAGFSFTGAELATVTGSKAPNTFNVTPSLINRFLINGDDPQFGASPGDVLNIDFSVVPSYNLTSTGPGSGVWSFGGGYQSVSFTSIENSLFSTFLPLQVLVVGGSGDAGQGAPLVKVVDFNTHALLGSFYAYETTFKGGVRIATADLNGDGAIEIITAPGPGRVGEVKIFKLDGTLLGSFTPEAASYKNGLYIAAGNVDGAGNFEIITSIGRGASKIRVYTVNGAFGASLLTTLSLPYSSSVIGGVVVASANVQGDGKWEIIAAPASGVAAQVRVFEWNGSTLIKKSQFNTFESTFKNGVSLAVGDIDGDGGYAEIFVGTGARGNSRVRTYRVSGQSGVQARNQFNAFTTGNPNAALRLTAHYIQSINRFVLFTAQANDGQTDEIRMWDLNPLTPVLIDKIIETGADFGGGINLG